MSVRDINQRTGMRNLGVTMRTPTSKATKEITKITVYPDGGSSKGSHNTVILVYTETTKQVIGLSANAAMEVVKGILQNMNDFTVAADDELQNIMKEKLGSANREAQAVVDCVRERYTASTTEPAKE